MARTILAIAQEAAERHATAPAPDKLFGTNNRIATILRNAAADTTREILRQTKWLGLSDFHSQWAFSTTPGRYAYPMPPDFLRMIEGSEMRGQWPLGLVGPATPQTWARWIAGLGAVTAPMGWRIRNDALFIEPTPQSVELLVIEYVSRWPVVRVVTTDDLDLTTTPITAKAPYVLRDGLITDGVEVPQAGDTFVYDTEPGFDEGVWSQEVEEYLKRVHPLSGIAPLAQLRQEEFTADTDRPAFADDHVLSLGMTARLRRALGLPYSEEWDEYMAELEAKIGNDAGGARGFTVGHNWDGCDTIPTGAGTWMLS